MCLSHYTRVGCLNFHETSKLQKVADRRLRDREKISKNIFRGNSGKIFSRINIYDTAALITSANRLDIYVLACSCVTLFCVYFFVSKMDHELIAVHSTLDNALAQQRQYKNKPCNTFYDTILPFILFISRSRTRFDLSSSGSSSKINLKRPVKKL